MTPSPPFPEDLDFAARALSGDLDALDELAVRLRAIPKFLESLPMSPHKRRRTEGFDDLAQDCALLVWNKLATFSGLSTFETWMFGICRFEFMNWSRRRRRDSSHLEGPFHEFEDELICFDNHDQLVLAQLLESVDCLKPPTPEIFRLRYGRKELTFREIAECVGRPEGSVKSFHSRAMAKLRRLFNKDLDENRK